jgi:2-alkyl-3-oxoalkanoate reductase
MKDKILITGAAGFIGSHLVDTLLKNGTPLSKLRLFVLPEESLTNLPDKKFDIIRGDIRDKKIVKKSLENITIVYHLAAKIDFDGKTYDEYKSVNVDGTKNFVDICKKKKIRKFVSYSSIGVHGLPAGIGDIVNWDETHDPTYTNFYGRSKWEAEEVVKEAHDKFKMPYAIIRPASVYGPREKGPTLALFKAIQSGQFLTIGNGENKMHYVYVQDLVDATILAANSKLRSGEYIIGGAKPSTMNEIVELVAKSIGVTKPKYSLPKNIALVISYILLLVTKITGIKLPLFPSRVKTMTTTYFYNISRAKKELGYKPKFSFKKGINITGKWYIKNKYL